MKLTKKEVEKICKEYDLGKLKEFSLIEKGQVNYNFDLSTSKGRYIVRVLAKGLTPWKKENLDLEFAVLKHLKKNKFPYQTPLPLKNKKNEILGRIGKKSFWVYKRLSGDSVSKHRDTSFIKPLMKVLSTYHHYLKNFKTNALPNIHNFYI